MSTQYVQCLLLVTLATVVMTAPLNHDPERGPLTAVSELTAAVSELSSRVAGRAARLQQNEREVRLPLPTPQDLDSIKKVAQILIMLGEQVIPAITGEPPSAPSTSGCDLPQEIPNDPVNVK